MSSLNESQDQIDCSTTMQQLDASNYLLDQFCSHQIALEAHLQLEETNALTSVSREPQNFLLKPCTAAHSSTLQPPRQDHLCSPESQQLDAFAENQKLNFIPQQYQSSLHQQPPEKSSSFH